MTNQWGLDRPNRRKQQMKRELIGLVTGSVFLLTGTAFLFNHSLNSGDATTAPPPVAAASTTTPTALGTSVTPMPAASMTAPTIAPPPSDNQPAPIMAAASINDTPERTAPAADTTVVTPTVTTVTPNTPSPTPPESGLAQQQMTGANTGSSANASISATVTPPATEVTTTNATTSATTGGVDAAMPHTPAAEPSAPTEAPMTAATRETPVVAASAGWIYAGQFVNGHWVEKGLSIGNELPVAGQTYAVSWGATVRSSPPSKNTGGKHAAIKGNIAAGKKVKVLQVKESGTKGHVWLEIAQ